MMTRHLSSVNLLLQALHFPVKFISFLLFFLHFCSGNNFIMPQPLHFLQFVLIPGSIECQHATVYYVVTAVHSMSGITMLSSQNSMSRSSGRVTESLRFVAFEDLSHVDVVKYTAIPSSDVMWLGQEMIVSMVQRRDCWHWPRLWGRANGALRVRWYYPQHLSQAPYLMSDPQERQHGHQVERDATAWQLYWCPGVFRVGPKTDPHKSKVSIITQIHKQLCNGPAMCPSFYSAFICSQQRRVIMSQNSRVTCKWGPQQGNSGM